MPISNRNLPPGTTLAATFKKEVYTCAVEPGEDGTARYRLADGRTFSSPSAAGSAVMGGTACNGWRFWSIEGEEPTTDDETATPQTTRAPKAKASKPKGAFKQVRKVPNQHGLAEGKVRWFCSACMKGFVVEDGSIPEACPEGHAREVADEVAVDA